MTNINNLVLFTEFSNSEIPTVILPTLPYYTSGVVDVKDIMNNSRGYKIEIPFDLTNKGADISNWESKNNPKKRNLEISNDQENINGNTKSLLKKFHESFKLHHMNNR